MLKHTLIFIFSISTLLFPFNTYPNIAFNHYVKKQCGAGCVNIPALVSSVRQASDRHQVPDNLIYAVMAVESSFRPKVVGGRINVGLMQVNRIAHRKKLKGNYYSVKHNVNVGTSILKACLKKSKGGIDKALSCYKGSRNTAYIHKVRRNLATIKQLRSGKLYLARSQTRHHLPVRVSKVKGPDRYRYKRLTLASR